MKRGPWRALPPAAVAFAACSWGTWSLVLRRAEAMGPMPSALESMIVMAVLTLVAGLASLRDRVPSRAGWRPRAWVAWLGVADALNVLLFFAAYKIKIGVSVLAHYLAPIFVAVASPLALGERLTRRTALAVVVSFAGLAMMVAPSGGDADASAVWRSAALGAGSALFYASNVVASKLVIESFSTSETMFWHGVVATPFLAAFVPRDRLGRGRRRARRLPRGRLDRARGARGDRLRLGFAAHAGGARVDPHAPRAARRRPGGSGRVRGGARRARGRGRCLHPRRRSDRDDASRADVDAGGVNSSFRVPSPMDYRIVVGRSSTFRPSAALRAA